MRECLVCGCGGDLCVCEGVWCVGVERICVCVRECVWCVNVEGICVCV